MPFGISAFWIVCAVSFAAIFYQIWSAILVRRFVKTRAQALSRWPSVSVLKPLCGDEPHLLENLRSFCLQDYPVYQIVFGVHTADDSAVAVVQALQDEMPALDIRLAIGRGRPENGNPKIANLLDMMPLAGHEILVIADSDMKVGPDYLKAVVSTLEHDALSQKHHAADKLPDIGVATCLYISHPAQGLCSILGAMGINHGFLPSVLVGQAVGRVDGCFGATMALSASMLEEIGGLEPLAEYLADDYMIGALVRKKGKRIGLVPLLPTTVANEPDVKTLVSHEVRWGRTLASIDRMGYAGTLVTQAVPLGLLALLADGGNLLGIGVMAMAWAARLLAVRIQEEALQLKRQPAWIVVVRDILTLAVQIAALSGRTVRWRGGHYRVLRHGILVSLGKR